MAARRRIAGRSGSGRASSAPAALHQAARLLTRRGLIVLVSDLLMDLADVERAMRGLRAAGPRRHGAAHHGSGGAPRAAGRAARRCSSTQRPDLSVPASIADVRVAYKNTVDEVIGEWRSMFGGLGISYELVSTDAPFGVPLPASVCRPPDAAVSFLAPFYLLLGGAVAVPLLLPPPAPPHRRAPGVSRRALSLARREGEQSHAPH